MDFCHPHVKTVEHNKADPTSSTSWAINIFHIDFSGFGKVNRIKILIILKLTALERRLTWTVGLSCV